MALVTLITLDHNEAQADAARYLIGNNRVSSGLKLKDFIHLVTAGIRQAKVYIGVDTVRANGTITLTSHVAADTVTINGVVFTAVASGATGNQYNIGGNDSITGDNLAAAINASVTALVAGYVTAVNNGGVVTIAAVRPGLSANMFTLAISAHGSVSGAKLTGGTDGALTSTTSYGSST